MKITMNPTTYGLSSKSVESDELTVDIKVAEGSYIVTIEEEGQIVNEFPLTVHRDLAHTIILDSSLEEE